MIGACACARSRLFARNAGRSPAAGGDPCRPRFLMALSMTLAAHADALRTAGARPVS